MEKKNEGFDFPESFVACDLIIVRYVNDHVSSRSRVNKTNMAFIKDQISGGR